MGGIQGLLDKYLGGEVGGPIHGENQQHEERMQAARASWRRPGAGHALDFLDPGRANRLIQQARGGVVGEVASPAHDPERQAVQTRWGQNALQRLASRYRPGDYRPGVQKPAAVPGAEVL